jgi:NADH:ubiquinone oxidoreductase subunit E
MVSIQICIGSACHLKGSYTIIDELQKLIKKDKLESKIEIKASFCLGQCTKGVSVKVDDDDIITVSPDTVHEFYHDNILRRVTQ